MKFINLGLFIVILLLSCEALSICVSSICDSQCRSIGFDTGICQGDSCYCFKNGVKLYSYIKSQDTIDAASDVLEVLKQENFVEKQESSVEKQQIPESVNSLLDSLASVKLNVCFDGTCNYQCKSQGKLGGYCKFGVCYCYN